MLQPATDTFTEILANAQREARGRNQEFVGLEHVALAVLDDDTSEAVRVLRLMHVESGYVRNALSHTLPVGKEPPIVTGDLPMSPKAHRLVGNAIVAAKESGAAKVSSRHLLAALVADAGGVVCESLRRSGADAAELLRALRTREVAPEA
ncbi:MAG TPA: Clp protease N-terminal domain-containing protein [Tepidisphaeraceae bacterium]|nr:Clp protease N-terminal domain-containing protein [Tepidisphaeraceae bacterium]